MNKFIDHLDQKDAEKASGDAKSASRSALVPAPSPAPRSASRRGVRMTVTGIERVEQSPNPGLHMVTQGPIRNLGGVPSRMQMGGGQVVTTIPTGCGCGDCSITIRTTGGIGVMNNTGPSPMSFTFGGRIGMQGVVLGSVGDSKRPPKGTKKRRTKK